MNRRLRENRNEITFDQDNPFTYVNIKNIMTTEKEHKLLAPGVKKPASAKPGTGPRSKLPTFDRLNGLAKGKSREGYFRKLKGQLSEMEINKEKDDVLIKNYTKFHNRQTAAGKFYEAKKGGINFKEIMGKPQKISMKNYVNYKREIFLSVMRQNDIEHNINEMKNFIKEVEDELESNLKTNKDDMIEMLKLKKKTKRSLDALKSEILVKEKELNDLGSVVTRKKNLINQIMNEVKDMSQQAEFLKNYEDFVLMIIEARKEDFSQSEPSSDEDDDGEEEGETNVFLTKQKEAKRNEQPDDILSKKELQNKILSQFSSTNEFVDKLRAIESKNLSNIKLVQNAKDDLNFSEIEYNKSSDIGKLQLKELSDTLKRLHVLKREKLLMLKEKKDFLENKLGNKINIDEDDPNYKSKLQEFMDDQFDVLRVEGLIDKLFNSYVDSDTKKQYKDEGTLKRLMAIEMTFDRLLQYKQEIIENPEYKDIKELYKRQYKQKMAENNRTKEEDLKHKLGIAKKQSMDSLDKRDKQIGRKPMTRNFLPENEKLQKVQQQDIEKLRALRHLTE